jgi:cyclopropane fatty-acyl-phospholipid synthase-like methyltransferase
MRTFEMQRWGDGYVTDIEYSDGFYPVQSPAHLRLAAAINGVIAPDLTSEYTSCELGCGKGKTALVFAAVNPQAEFHAVDFHPGHIAHARERAEQAQLHNIKFHEYSFEEMTGPRGAGLPQFDVITMHGVWSWIAPKLQEAIVAFINARLKPGGLVHVSYNALPAWNQMAPLQRIIKELADSSNSRSDVAIQRVMVQIQKLAAANILPAKFHDGLKKIRDNADKMLRYVAHEYLNEHWQPVYHADVARAFAGAKMTYAASAELLKNFYNLALTEEQRLLLTDVTAEEVRETLKDFCTDQWFREDVFVRGARHMHPAHREKLFAEQELALVRPPPDIIEIGRPDGSKWRPDPVVYGAVVSALRRGPRRVVDLLRLESLPSGHPVSAVELVGIMVGTGLAAIHAGASADQMAGAERLNALLDVDPDLGMTRGATIAVPGTRSGVTLSAADFALYQDLRRGRSPSADALADRFMSRCRTMGCHPVLEEKTYEDEGEARTELTREYQMKIERFVPLWRLLGMI